MSKVLAWANIYEDGRVAVYETQDAAETMFSERRKGRIAVPLYEHPPAESAFWQSIRESAKAAENAPQWQQAGINLNPKHFETCEPEPANPDPPTSKQPGQRRVRWEDSKARAWLISVHGEVIDYGYSPMRWTAAARGFVCEGLNKFEAVNALRRKVEGK